MLPTSLPLVAARLYRGLLLSPPHPRRSTAGPALQQHAASMDARAVASTLLLTGVGWWRGSLSTSGALLAVCVRGGGGWGHRCPCDGTSSSLLSLLMLMLMMMMLLLSTLLTKLTFRGPSAQGGRLCDGGSKRTASGRARVVLRVVVGGHQDWEAAQGGSGRRIRCDFAANGGAGVCAVLVALAESVVMDAHAYAGMIVMLEGWTRNARARRARESCCVRSHAELARCLRMVRSAQRSQGSFGRLSLHQGHARVLGSPCVCDDMVMY
jgi:hypothetical protein